MKTILAFIFACLFLSTVSADQYGPINSSDTLWSIASKYKPKHLTTNQYLKDIYLSNPHAFRNNNINVLIEGSYLELAKEVKPLIADKAAKNKPKPQRNLNVLKTVAALAPMTLTPMAIAAKRKPLVLISKASTGKPKKHSTEVKIQPTSPVKNKVLMQKKVRPVTLKVKKEEALEIKISYDVSSSYDDNIRVAQKYSDIRDDVIFQGILKASTTFELNPLNQLKLGLTLAHDSYKTFSLLNKTTYAINSQYIFALNGAYSAPLFIIKFDMGGIESNSVMRQANFIKMGFDVNKRISNKIVFTTGVRFQRNDSQSEVFDTEKLTAFLNVDFALDRKNLIYSTYHYITGDVVSSATPNLDIINVATKIEADDAFGGVAANQFAYKIDSTSHVMTLGFNYFQSKSISYDISARFISSWANDNPNIYYKRSIIRAGILGRF